jgi:hypothetical protein
MDGAIEQGRYICTVSSSSLITLLEDCIRKSPTARSEKPRKDQTAFGPRMIR